MEDFHGGDIYSQPVRLDYSININPLGMPLSVQKAAMESLKDSSVYPDSQCRKLRRALAGFHQVPEEKVVCGNGAADLIFALVLALKPRKALVTAPAFSEYSRALKAYGCQIGELALREEEGFQLDLEEFSRTVERFRPDLVFLCNPNNPTGIALSREQAACAARICEEFHSVLALDECFCDFLEDPQASSLIPDLSRFSNLFILRAFTKTYAMAGLRLGYGLSWNEKLLEQINLCRQPWSVSQVAQEAGLAALQEQAYLDSACRMIREEGRRLKEGLKNLGMKVFDSQANYILFSWPGEFGTEQEERERPYTRGVLYDRLLKQGILIRPCGGYSGLNRSFYRICIGEPENNRKFLETLEQVLKGV